MTNVFCQQQKKKKKKRARKKKCCPNSFKKNAENMNIQVSIIYSSEGGGGEKGGGGGLCRTVPFETGAHPVPASTNKAVFTHLQSA